MIFFTAEMKQKLDVYTEEGITSPTSLASQLQLLLLLTLCFQVFVGTVRNVLSSTTLSCPGANHAIKPDDQHVEQLLWC